MIQRRNHEESVTNLNILVQRAKYEESHADETRKEHITHRKTKVICSLGGNTTNIKAICELLAKGMNICRINMAQIRNKEHKVLIQMVREAAKIKNTKCGIYIDLPGPRIRLGELENGEKSVNLKAG